MKPLDASGWLVVLTSYAAAAITFVISNSLYFWGSAGYGPITHFAGPIGVPAFLVWLCATGWVSLRYGRAGWWVLLGAPFALWTPLRIFLYVVAVMLYHP